jgi:HEAT repeat protein
MILPAHRINYARRLQYRRLSRAGAAAAAGSGGVLLAAVLASDGARSLGGLVLVLALGLGLYSRHWLSLARRSAVGARSEDAVRRVLQPLQAEDWRMRHSLQWQGEGDIDSVAIAPTGIAIDRDEDQDVRRAASRSRARAGGVAVAAPAKVGAQRGARHHVHHPCQGS